MILAFSKGINYIYLGAAQLRAGIANLFSLRPVVISLGIALVLNILNWVFAGSLNSLLGGDLAILHYNVIFGIDNVGSATSLYILPLFGLGLILVNLIVALIIGDKRQRLFTYFLSGFAALGNLLLLLALYFIYLVNFS